MTKASTPFGQPSLMCRPAGPLPTPKPAARLASTSSTPTGQTCGPRVSSRPQRCPDSHQGPRHRGSTLRWQAEEREAVMAAKPSKKSTQPWQTVAKSPLTKQRSTGNLSQSRKPSHHHAQGAAFRPNPIGRVKPDRGQPQSQQFNISPHFLAREISNIAPQAASIHSIPPLLCHQEARALAARMPPTIPP